MLWNHQRMKLIRGLFPLAFQNSHNGKDRVPVARGCWHTKELIDPTKIADGLHVPTVHTKDELVLRRDYTHEPLPVGRKCDWQGGAEVSGFRQDAHESNDVAARRLGSKRILRLQADEIATVAEHDVRFEGQLSKQCSTELRFGSRFVNDKGTGSTDIHDAIVAQALCEDAWAKRPMSANVYTAKENDKSHVSHWVAMTTTTVVSSTARILKDVT
jgi:hypothetical protein